jgi:hypothetical protein
MRRLQECDAVLPSEQIRRVLRLWLDSKGPPTKRRRHAGGHPQAPLTRKPQQSMPCGTSALDVNERMLRCQWLITQTATLTPSAYPIGENR